MSILDNPSENRLRSPFRISFYIVGMAILWVLAGIIQGAFSGLGPIWLTTSISYLTISLLATVLVYTTGKWVDNRSFYGFGFMKSKLWIRELLEGIVITSVVVLIAFIVGLFFNLFEITGWRPGNVSPQTWFPPLIGYIIMMASVAYYEELLFRGYLTLNLFEGLTKDPLRTRSAAIVSTLIISGFFALVHANNPNATWLGVFNILLAGIMLGVPYFLTGSLAMPIGIHFAWNFIQGPILGIPVSGIVFRSSMLQTDAVGAQVLSGGNFGLEGGLLGTIAITLILVMTLYIIRKRYPLTEVHPALTSQSVMMQK